MLNILKPPVRFSIYNKTASSAVDDVTLSSIMPEAREAVAENKQDNASLITACFFYGT
jgi:hypothetical protein